MLVTIGHYLNPIEAHIIRGRLEAEGMPAYVQHEHHIWAKWTLSLALGFVKVQVNSQDANAALTIIEQIQAGEFALIDEDESETHCCPRCGTDKTVRVNLYWKLALCVAVLFSAAVPYSIFQMKCCECKHSWTQKALRGYPLWYSAFAILLISSSFVVFDQALYYLCKINHWNDWCI